MSLQPIDNQSLLDRAAIQDVLARYFQGLDRCDPELVRRCFTEDIQAHYDERSPVRGIEEMMDSMRTFKRMKAGEMRTTTHFMGNLNFSLLEKDVAETETNAIAFLVRPGQPAGQIAMRSLRYLDRLRRVSDGWRISERLHTLDWSCEVPATFSVTLAHRLMTLPKRAL